MVVAATVVVAVAAVVAVATVVVVVEVQATRLAKWWMWISSHGLHGLRLSRRVLLSSATNCSLKDRAII